MVYGRGVDLRCGNGSRFPPTLDLGDGLPRVACPRLGVVGPDRRRMFFVCAILKSLRDSYRRASIRQVG